MSKARQVAIIYGWAEGPWHAKRLVQALARHGIELTNNISSADIILAHSAGCYFLPANTKAQHIILIGLSYWPKKPLLISLAQKLWWEVKHHHHNKDLRWWFNKMIHNIAYIFTKPSRSYMYVINRSRLNLPRASQVRQVSLVRNAEDSFCHPHIQKILPLTSAYKLIEMPGVHDDCWAHPQPYVDLMLKEL